MQRTSPPVGLDRHPRRDNKTRSESEREGGKGKKEGKKVNGREEEEGAKNQRKKCKRV